MITDDRRRGMKLAYWPGCVSRGFTPELHGSMALVAERLGIELVDARPRQLLRRRRDRRAQPGARRHAQRAHLRARPEDRPGDDEHLLDLPGRAVGMPAAPRRRLAPTAPTSTRRSPTRGSSTKDKARLENKNFLWLLVEDYGLDGLRRRSRARSPACASGRSTAATSSAPSTASATTSTPSATSTSSR